MSKLKTKTDLLESKINALFSSKYNFYSENKRDGYKSPFFKAIGHHVLSNTTTNCYNKYDILFDIEMGINYSCIGGSESATREELTIDLELIFNRIAGVQTGEIDLWDGMNQETNTKFVDFQIKL
jgi:hypothetical protein